MLKSLTSKEEAQSLQTCTELRKLAKQYHNIVARLDCYFPDLCGAKPSQAEAEDLKSKFEALDCGTKHALKAVYNDYVSGWCNCIDLEINLYSILADNKQATIADLKSVYKYLVLFNN